MISKKRVVWIDYARALAIVFVVLCHATELVYQLSLEGVLMRSSLSQAISFLLFTIGRLGVPFFLFMSGYLMLDRKYECEDIKKFYKSKWLGILLATEIWILIYSAYRVLISHHAIDPIWVIDNMLFLAPFDLMPHIWYMPMILGFYLLLPVMANGLNSLKEPKVLLLPLGLIIVISFVVPVINTFNAALGVDLIAELISTGFSGGEYGCYLILGYFCKRGMFKNIHSIILMFIFCFGVGATVGEQMFSYNQEVAYNVWYNNIFLLLAALSLFVLLSRVVLKTNHFVILLAKYSFAIYLIHIFVLYGIGYIGRLTNLGIPSSVYVVLLTIVVSILSLFACMLIEKIPKFGKIALYMR